MMTNDMVVERSLDGNYQHCSTHPEPVNPPLSPLAASGSAIESHPLTLKSVCLIDEMDGIVPSANREGIAGTISSYKSSSLTEASPIHVEVSFRGRKVVVPVMDQSAEANANPQRKGAASVGEIKQRVVHDYQSLHHGDSSAALTVGDIKLLYRGKVLTDNSQDLFSVVAHKSKSVHSTTSHPASTIYKMVALGVSPQEKELLQRQHELLERQQRILVRDDLSREGQQQARQRQLQSQRRQLVLQDQETNKIPSKFGFERIETLPNLHDRERAEQILRELASDPGILACMKKHEWTVGCLAELLPDGFVGQSAVCVMGLNQNKGQKILLRLRTDDLSGFRKMLSIKKVLYHELAHNVHSEHDQAFFILMRQIEKECNDLMHEGKSLSSSAAGSYSRNGANDEMTDEELQWVHQGYVGGSYRLGGEHVYHNRLSVPVASHSTEKREQLARAAMLRMSEQEANEITGACGGSCTCDANTDLFLPQPDSPIEENESYSKQ
jgi:WLM domain